MSATGCEPKTKKIKKYKLFVFGVFNVSKNGENVILCIQFKFIWYFYYLITMARTTKTVVNKSNSKYVCLVHDFRSNTFRQVYSTLTNINVS